MDTAQASQAPNQTTPVQSAAGKVADTNSIPRNNLGVKTLEIRWHDSKPISSCNFQPRPLKRTRSTHHIGSQSGSGTTFASHQTFAHPESCYKLATGGGGERYPGKLLCASSSSPILPFDVIRYGCSFEGETPDSATNIPRPPKVEYLSTLRRHLQHNRW
jgi:chromatin assembly factor 1 subunit B